MLADSLILPGHGFTSARGFDLVSIGAWQASFRTTLYLALVAGIGLGVTAAVRDSAAAIGTVLGLRGLPLTPWQGLGVVALWAAGALVLGGLVLRLRDA